MDLKVLFNSINVLIDSFSEHSSHVEYLRSFAAIVALFDQYKKHLLKQNMWDEKTHEVVEEIIYWCGAIATKEVLGLQASEGSSLYRMGNGIRVLAQVTQFQEVM